MVNKNDILYFCGGFLRRRADPKCALGSTGDNREANIHQLFLGRAIVCFFPWGSFENPMSQTFAKKMRYIVAMTPLERAVKIACALIPFDIR